MDEKMELVLPESPLKTVSGKIRLSIVFWIYLSLMVSSSLLISICVVVAEEMLIVGVHLAIFGVFVY